jgi:hypothetical protein
MHASPPTPCHAFQTVSRKQSRDTCQGEQLTDNRRRRCATALFLLSEQRQHTPTAFLHPPSTPGYPLTCDAVAVVGSDGPRSALKVNLDFDQGGFGARRPHVFALASQCSMQHVHAASAGRAQWGRPDARPCARLAGPLAKGEAPRVPRTLGSLRCSMHARTVPDLGHATHAPLFARRRRGATGASPLGTLHAPRMRACHQTW